MVLQGHSKGVNSLSFSSDGESLASGSDDKTVIIWDPEGNRATHRLMGHKDRVLDVDFSKLNAHVCSGSKDKTLIVWDCKTGDKLFTLDSHGDAVSACRFSPNGFHIISASTDKEVLVWDLELAISTLDSHDIPASNLIQFRCTGHTDDVRCAEYSPDGNYFATAGKDQTVLLWDSHSGKQLNRFEGHTDTVSSVCFSPDGKSILSGSSDKSAIIWDTLTGQVKRRFHFTSRPITSLAFSPDGKSIIAGADGKYIIDHTECIQGHEQGKKLRDPFGNPVTSVEYGPAGEYFVSGSTDTTITLWDKDGQKLSQHKEDFLGAISAVKFTPDSKYVLTSASNTILVWEIIGPKLKKHSHLETRVNDLACFPDCKTVVTAGYENLILWDIESGKMKMKIPGHEYDVTAVAVSPDGSAILSGGQDTKLMTWDAQSGQPRAKLQGHTDEITSAEFSHDGTLFASSSKDKTIVVWDTHHLTERIRLVGHMSTVSDISFHPDNKNIVSASVDHTTVLWCIKTGLHKMKIHRDEPINDICFAPNGLSFLEAVGDGTVRITPNLAWEHRVPAAVESEIFRNDLESMRIEFGKNWHDTPTSFLLKSFPEALLNTNEGDNSHRNLVHVAACKGCAGFLKTFVQDVALNSTEKDRKSIVLSACLTRDTNDRSPLYYAVESQDTSCVCAVLDCLMLAFDDDFALLSSECATYIHLADLFPLEDLLHVVDKFPTIGLRYLGKLKLVTAYENIVLKNCERVPLDDDEQVVKGSEERSPDGFWKREFPEATNVDRVDLLTLRSSLSLSEGAASSIRSSFMSFGSHFTSAITDDSEDNGVPVTAKLLPLKDVSRSDLLKVAVKASEETKSFTVFESEVLMALTNFMWETRIRRQFLKHLAVEIFMVGLFTTDALLHSKSQNKYQIKFDGTRSDNETLLLMLPGVVILFPWYFFVRHEYRQFMAGKVGLRTHVMGSILNFMDFTSLLLIFVTFFVRVFERSTHFTDFWFTIFNTNIREQAQVISTVTLASGLPVLYLNLLKYMQAFRVSGELVSMIFGVLKGIMAFTMILVIVMVGFALGFFVLFTSDTNHEVGEYSNVLMAILTSYTYVYGEFDLGAFEQSTSYLAAIGLFVIFMYIVNLVLLNLLIAIMGDIYDSIQENARAQFLFSKASLILEFEEVMGGRKANKEEQMLNRVEFPKWLQVLEPIKTKGESDSESWAGRVRVIKKAIFNAAQQTKEIVTSVHDTVTNIFQVVKENSSDVVEIREEVKELRLVLLQVLKENSSVNETLNAIRDENRELRHMMERRQHHGSHHHHHSSATPQPSLPPPVSGNESSEGHGATPKKHKKGSSNKRSPSKR